MHWMNRTNVIGLVVLAATTLLGFVAGIQPIIAAHAEAVLVRGRIAAAERELVELEAKEHELRETARRYREEIAGSSINPDLSTARNQRFAQLAQLAQAMGVELQTVRPGDRVDGPHGATMEIVITGIGPFADSVELISRMRSVFPDFGVRRLSFQREDDTNARFSLGVVWFMGTAGAGSDG